MANLVAAFVRPQASPIIAVGGAFIDRTPPALKNFAVEKFGENDKTMLLLGMYVTIALLAIVIGMIAWRRVGIGVAGTGLFGLFGAFVAITRPESHVTDVIPSVVGGIVGIVALVWLHSTAARRPGLPPWTDTMTRTGVPSGTYSPAPPPNRPNRRNFLIASGAAATVAAAAGIGGQYLQNKRFSVNTSSVKLGKPAVKAEPLPKGAEITDIPGLSSFYTPNSQFYRVDTALVVPQVSPQTWQLRIHGMVSNPMTINFDDLMKRPMFDHDITLTCVSENVGGGYIGNARWQGALLADLLKEAGIQPGATQIVMRDVNGMNLGVATEPVMDGRASLLAVGMNGQPLPQEHGFPVRVVVPGLYGYVSACKWVVDMQLTTFGAFDAYWTQRGWSQQAPIKTESRIDTPKGGTVNAGTVMIAGVAWAQHRGIEAVEVGIDGTWHQAKLAVQDTIDTWRQWYYPWQATAGKHTLQVRATDKTGYTQTVRLTTGRSRTARPATTPCRSRWPDRQARDRRSGCSVGACRSPGRDGSDHREVPGVRRRSARPVAAVRGTSHGGRPGPAGAGLPGYAAPG